MATVGLVVMVLLSLVLLLLAFLAIQPARQREAGSAPTYCSKILA